MCAPGCLPFGRSHCIAETLAVHHQAIEIHGSNATITDTQINTGLFGLTAVLSNAIRIAQFRPSFLMNLEIELISFCASSFFPCQCVSPWVSLIFSLLFQSFYPTFLLCHSVCYSSSASTFDFDSFVPTSVWMV